MQLWLYYGRLCVYSKHSSFVRLFAILYSYIPYQANLPIPAQPASSHAFLYLGNLAAVLQLSSNIQRASIRYSMLVDG